MRAELESKEIENRGVILTAETAEEGEMLKNLWVNKAKPAAYNRVTTWRLASIVFAPTPVSEDGK